MQPLLVYGPSAAFDRDSKKRVVLFGGGSGGVDQNTTWLWNQMGATWTLLSMLQSPPAREGAGMTYDAALQRVILFGGQDNNVYFNDTWDPFQRLLLLQAPPLHLHQHQLPLHLFSVPRAVLGLRLMPHPSPNASTIRI